MNSRDAAFDESLKEIIEATAAEAAAAHDTVSVASTGNRDGLDEDMEPGPSRKKRKRTEEDTYVLMSLYLIYISSLFYSTIKKRTRSVSTASDAQGSTAVVRDDTPGQTKTQPPVPAPPSRPPGRVNKRSGRKAVPSLPLDTTVAIDGEDGAVIHPFNRSAPLT